MYYVSVWVIPVRYGSTKQRSQQHPNHEESLTVGQPVCPTTHWLTHTQRQTVTPTKYLFICLFIWQGQSFSAVPELAITSFTSLDRKQRISEKKINTVVWKHNYKTYIFTRDAQYISGQEFIFLILVNLYYQLFIGIGVDNTKPNCFYWLHKCSIYTLQYRWQCAPLKLACDPPIHTKKKISNNNNNHSTIH